MTVEPKEKEKKIDIKRIHVTMYNKVRRVCNCSWNGLFEKKNYTYAINIIWQ